MNTSKPKDTRINWVRFNDEKHEYTTSSGEVYISATQMLSRYKAPFDGAYWSLYKAAERFLIDNDMEGDWLRFKRGPVKKLLKQVDQLQQAVTDHFPTYLPYMQELQTLILSEWDEKRDRACAKGTAYHLFREQQAYQAETQQLTNSAVSGKVSTSYSFNLDELLDGYHAELLVYNHQYKLAGLIDRTWITTQPILPSQIQDYVSKQIWWIDEKPHIRVIHLDDFKSNRAIKVDNRYETMKAPVAHLPDCNYNHYRLQLSLYAWMLEQVGYVVEGLRFTHINDLKHPLTGESELDPFTGQTLSEEIPYLFDYMRDDIEALIKDYHESTNR